jgi:hypothetical protein
VGLDLFKECQKAQKKSGGRRANRYAVNGWNDIRLFLMKYKKARILFRIFTYFGEGGRERSILNRSTSISRSFQ